MININLDVLSKNPWLLTMAWIVGVVAAVLALIALARKLWQINRSAVRGWELLEKLQPWMDKTDATLAAQNVQIKDIHYQIHENGGGSVKDGLKRVETDIGTVKTELATLTETQGRLEEGIAGLYVRANATDTEARELRKDLEDTRPVRPITRRPPKERST